MRKPDHPNYNRRARHHDYRRPAKYLITTLKNPTIPPFAKIEGDPRIAAGQQPPQPAIPPFAKIEGDPRIAAGEQAPHSVITATGNFILEALKWWLEKYPQIEVAEFVIMPDHIHMCVHVRSYLPNGLSIAMSGLKGKVSSLRHAALPERFRQEGMVSVFEKGFNDRIAYNDEHWGRQIIYVRDNPRRYLIKRLFPDYMYRRWSLKIGDEVYVAKGNILLLKEPELFVVKHHRRWSAAESDNYQTACRLKIENGGIPVSPFIHPKEKELRNYAIEDGGCYIRICENGFAEREQASGMEFNMMAAGRLLLIAPAAHDSQKRELKYAYAKVLNTLAAKLVEMHDKGISCIIHG